MSYTLNVEPNIVHDAEMYALRNGTTLDSMIRACMLVIISRGVMENANNDSKENVAMPSGAKLKVGAMASEINLPNGFDEEFDALDGEVSSMFSGAM